MSSLFSASQGSWDKVLDGTACKWKRKTEIVTITYRACNVAFSQGFHGWNNLQLSLGFRQANPKYWETHWVQGCTHSNAGSLFLWHNSPQPAVQQKQSNQSSHSWKNIANIDIDMVTVPKTMMMTATMKLYSLWGVRPSLGFQTGSVTLPVREMEMESSLTNTK